MIDLVSAILDRPVVDVEVRNNEIPPGDTEEKAERLDVNCSVDDGTQVDLEMQASRIEEDLDGNHANLNGKSVYYLCDLHSSQPSKGSRRYDRLAPTYQVTFCSYTVFPNRPEYVNSFSLRHDRDNEFLSAAIHVDQYASEPKYRETVNEVIASKEVLQMAGNLLMSFSQDERERAVFRSRRMYQTDMQSNLATAEDRGERRGRAEGQIEATATNLRSLMESMDISLEEAMQALHISEDDRARYTELLPMN